MTTILVINAVSSLLAAAGLGGILVQRKRREATIQPVYVTTAGKTRRLRED
jgi:hypothetical protein